VGVEEDLEKSKNEYGISEYPNVKEIYEKLGALVNQPLRPIRRDEMEKVLSYYDFRCQRSKALAEKARQFIPKGVQHNLSYNYPFPLAFEKAGHGYMWDVDGNQYIDFLQAGGAILLDENYPAVSEKVIELIQSGGQMLGLFHESELKLTELINKYMPSVEMLRLFASGTEAAMAAIRVARAYTKKKKIVKMGAAYHGWSDQLVFSVSYPGWGAREAIGIPPGCYQDTQEFYPNDLDGLRELLKENEKSGDGTAAVIVEPLGGESGTRPVYPDFNKRVRELCDEFGTLLIFDEVVTAFRIGMGGAQGYFGVKPDLTVFGKAISGGFPMAGGVGGRRDIMDMFSRLTPGGVVVGGTLSANPLSCTAGYYALLEVARTHAPVVAGKAGDRLRKGLQEIIDHYNLPFVVYNMGSIVHFETSGAWFLDLLHNEKKFLDEVGPRTQMMKEMGAAYQSQGIVTLVGNRMYTSLADTNEIIDEALNRFEYILSKVEGVRK